MRERPPLRSQRELRREHPEGSVDFVGDIGIVGNDDAGADRRRLARECAAALQQLDETAQIDRGAERIATRQDIPQATLIVVAAAAQDRGENRSTPRRAGWVHQHPDCSHRPASITTQRGTGRTRPAEDLPWDGFT